MKQLILAILFCIMTAHASSISYGFGSKSQQSGFVGLYGFNNFGIEFENSIYARDIEFQYGKISILYEWDFKDILKGTYSIWGKMDYGDRYHIYGATLDINCDTHLGGILLGGSLQPFYDSFYKRELSYKFFLKRPLFHDIYISLGEKNIPDYRKTEHRFFINPAFVNKSLIVFPELSFTSDFDSDTMRFSIYFIYRNLFQD